MEHSRGRPGCHVGRPRRGADDERPAEAKALAVAARERSALLPQVPTFEEAGVNGFVVDTWYGLMAPAGTPADVLRRLHQEASGYGQSPAMKERLQAAGLEPQVTCGDPFAAQVAREIESNTRLARELNLKAE